jgi:hypothetical protein
MYTSNKLLNIISFYYLFIYLLIDILYLKLIILISGKI